MNQKRKKLIIFAVILSAVLNIIVSASDKLVENKNYDWYFIPASDNKQPRFDVNLEELKKYDAYAIGNPDDKVIYLTFDFGYENGNVKKCLDTLNEHKVKASFFILEHVVKANTDLLKEIAETGHVTGNHSMKHKNMRDIKDFSKYKSEIVELEKIYEETTGYKMSKYFRPPEGSYTKQNLEYNKKLGYKTIFWSVAYADWDEKNQPDKTQAIQKVLKLTHNGAIILLHPTSSTNAAILGTLIETWKEQGYRFATLDELDFGASTSSTTSVTSPAAPTAPTTPNTSTTVTTPPKSTPKSQPESNTNQKENTVQGNILNSDIMAYINGNAIPSWSANSRTVVVAEDLVNYGFDVAWNDKEKTLKIAYNAGREVTPIKTVKNTKKTGSIYCKYFASSIKVYISGKEVQAYNIDGETLVNIEDLSAAYGSSVWDATKREIKITLR